MQLYRGEGFSISWGKELEDLRETEGQKTLTEGRDVLELVVLTAS